MINRFWVTILAFFFPCILFAQGAGEPGADEYTLQELLNMKVTVASGVEDRLHAAPGIISVITGDDIRFGMYRDMIDVLRTVPGLDFSQDVENVVGPVVRGNWAQEGKMLFLIDGIEMHETLYGTLQFLQHFPIFSISRIEIIRGPGSVVYGGNAALCVINIITRKAEEINGLRVGYLGGHFGDVFARNHGALSIGKKFNDDFSLDLSGLYKQGIVSNQSLFATDSMSALSYRDSSDFLNRYLNACMKYKKTELRYIYDDLNHDVTNANYGYRHDGHSFLLRSDWAIGETFRILPSVMVRRTRPWNYLSDNDSLTALNALNIRSESVLQLQYRISDRFDLIGGFRYLYDASEYAEGSGYVFNYNGSARLDFHTYSMFSQATARLKPFTIIAGLRYEKHNVYGAVLLPRVNLTRSFGRIGIDLQYSEAFRSPSIINIDFNRGIQPEIIKDKELEVSYRLTDNQNLALNLFHIDILRPIVYTYDGYNEFYRNAEHSGTMGIELEYLYKNARNMLKGSLSWYTANKNLVEEFSVNGRPELLLSAPAWKAILIYRLFAGKHGVFQFNANGISERFGYDGTDALYRVKPMCLMAFSTGFRNLMGNRMDILLGVNDLFNEQYRFIQAYRSGADMLPGPGREYNLKISYVLSMSGN